MTTTSCLLPLCVEYLALSRHCLIGRFCTWMYERPRRTSPRRICIVDSVGTTFASPSVLSERGSGARGAVPSRSLAWLAASGPIGNPRARHATATKAGNPRAVRVGLQADSSHVSACLVVKIL